MNTTTPLTPLLPQSSCSCHEAAYTTRSAIQSNISLSKSTLQHAMDLQSLCTTEWTGSAASLYKERIGAIVTASHSCQDMLRTISASVAT